jgi:hypothetical protein
MQVINVKGAIKEDWRRGKSTPKGSDTNWSCGLWDLTDLLLL